jgi:hypothetical protein
LLCMTISMGCEGNPRVLDYLLCSSHAEASMSMQVIEITEQMTKRRAPDARMSLRQPARGSRSMFVGCTTCTDAERTAVPARPDAAPARAACPSGGENLAAVAAIDRESTFSRARERLKSQVFGNGSSLAS